MTCFRTLLALAILALAPPAAALAETSAASAEPAAELEANADRDPVWSEVVVVTATRSELKLGDLPNHTTVISRQELARDPEGGLSDVVRQITSLNLAGDQDRLVANHRDQSLNFRGVSGSNVSHGLLLVDGLPLLDPYNASALWSKVPKELVERVEVVRGGAANVWGSLALSGVVNLITRAPSDRRLAISLRGESRSTRSATASYADVRDPWAGWIGADLFDTDGYFTFAPEDRAAIDEPEFRGYESLTGRLTRELGPSAGLRVGALFYSEDRGEGTPVERASFWERSLSLSLDRVGSAGGSWQFRLFGRSQDHQDDGSDEAADRSSQELASRIYELPTLVTGASAVWSSPGGPRRSLSAGADLSLARIERREDLRPAEGLFTQRSVVEGQQQLGGVFVRSRFTPSPDWSWHLAGRFDVIRTVEVASETVLLATGEPLLSDRPGDETQTTFNPSIGFTHQARDNLRLRGAAYTGFRAPMPSEAFVGRLSSRNRVTVPNPALEPETLVGAELGVDLLRTGGFDARATAFWSRTRDLIQRVVVGRAGPAGEVIEPCGPVGPRGQCRQFRNLGETEAAGLELDATYRPAPRWRLSFGATVLRTEVTDNPDDPDLVGNWVPVTPERRWALGVDYAHPKLGDLLLRGRYVGDRFDDAENRDPLDGYQVVDLSLRRPINRRWELSGGVRNLFDEQYEVGVSSDLYRIGAPRIFHLGVRFEG